MKTHIISFYCDIEGRTYYSDCAVGLTKKFIEFGLNYSVEQLESHGNYMSNCLRKPGFILKKLEEYKKPLIWMDIDTELREPFNHFDNIDQDIGFCTNTGDITGFKATPIFFNYTEKSLLFVKRWNEECIKAINENRIELDHDVMKYIILPEFNGKIKIKLLSENYMDFFNGKYIKSRLSKEFSTKRIAHKNIKEINKYRSMLNKHNFINGE